MGGETKLSGPDLSKGIAADSVTEGDKLLGHSHGEPVLVSRIKGEFFAIGASCTHYGGPLGEGMIVGDTVRCPWHHACFSLKTGEALRAPALNPVARWHVEQRDGQLFVNEKVERDPLAPTYPIGSRSKTPPQRVVIVGAGAAGSAAAEMLRRSGYHGSITLVDAEPDSPYDRPNLSKDYLAGNAPEEWIPLRPPDFYKQNDIQVVRGNATRLDATRKTLSVDGAGDVAYDALLLATGAEPVKLPIPGVDQKHVHYLRSLADSRSIIAAAKTAKKAVVIGTSFIGLEVAASLRARNLEVDVVAPEQIPLERVLGDQMGRFIKSLHEEKGVRFHLGKKPAKIETGAVALDDGSKLNADLVVIGVGVRPRLTLAEQAGLLIDKGVVVNEYLETSTPGIYAAGDIARFPDPLTGDKIRIEHWVVAQRMGQTAARNIIGATEKYEFAHFFWSAHYDVSINYVGHAEKWDIIKVDGSPEARDVAVRYVAGGKTLAVATLWRDAESLAAEVEMEREAAAGD